MIKLKKILTEKKFAVEYVKDMDKGTTFNEILSQLMQNPNIKLNEELFFKKSMEALFYEGISSIQDAAHIPIFKSARLMGVCFFFIIIIIFSH